MNTGIKYVKKPMVVIFDFNFFQIYCLIIKMNFIFEIISLEIFLEAIG